MGKYAPPAAAGGLSRWLSEAGVICALTLLAATSAHAQTSAAPSSDQSSSAAAQSEPGFLGDLFAPSRTNLLGDMFGLRTALGQHGITLSVTDVDEWLGNVSGGFRHGATYEGLTTVTIQLDTQKAGGWAGGLFNLSGLQIRGLDLSQVLSGHSADGERHRSRRYNSVLGDLVRSDVPGRQSRCEDRTAEHRPGVPHQRAIEPVRQHRDGLADPAD